MSVGSTRGVVTPWPRGLIDDGQSDEKTESSSETNSDPAHRRGVSDHDQTQDDKCTNDQTAHDSTRQNSIHLNLPLTGFPIKSIPICYPVTLEESQQRGTQGSEGQTKQKKEPTDGEELLDLFG